jgi:hypothetical protein
MEIMAASPVAGQYDETVDRESAYELLARRAARSDERPRRASSDAEEAAIRRSPGTTTSRRAQTPARARETATERFVKNVAGSVGRQVGTIVVRQVGNAIVRGILGGILRR